MGYRDDFYCIDNIIGYTGNLIGKPTVYFRQGNHYGRITQWHGIATNIGRASVRWHPAYHIGNYYVAGRLVAQEYEGRDLKHTSRNPFIRREQFRPLDITLLTGAIRRCQDVKRCEDPVIGHQTSMKMVLHAELGARFDTVRDPMNNMGRVNDSPAMAVIMGLTPEQDDPRLRRGGEIG
ncbi:hypothetical protein [Mangrovicoccus algicola]|uniref:Uncharacterized protein n=1 Tax=Mangrovicoccus algicola TaxID=2771008 RepID=A0A8J6YVV1_9RHOB|nr:hypothetical protein [Mangrovicoccus algicola]MBE3637013.1 hypothetical protein [Mangrovicoccus algicola]